MASTKTLRRRRDRARKRYIRSKTRANLRLYLRRKAQLAVHTGHELAGFDDRMCAYYPGVSANVNEGCKRAIVRAYAAGLVPTSTLRFPVGGGSYHQARNSRGRGKAADFGLVEAEISTTRGRNRMVAFQRAELNRRRRGGGRIDGDFMVELIGPDNAAIVLRGLETDLPEGTPLEQQHDNHVHEAYDS